MSKSESKKKLFKPRDDGRKPFLVEVTVTSSGEVLVLAADPLEARKIAKKVFDVNDADDEVVEFDATSPLNSWPDQASAKETFHTSVHGEEITIESMTYTDEELIAMERAAAMDKAQARLFGSP